MIKMPQLESGLAWKLATSEKMNTDSQVMGFSSWLADQRCS